MNELPEQSQPVGVNQESSHAIRDPIKLLRRACLALALSAFIWLHILNMISKVRMLHADETRCNNVT